MEDRVFEVNQYVRAPRRKVFEFFSDARNLEAITPPWLRFRIVRQTTPAICEGTEFTYTLRIHGMPFRWKSKILDWRDNESFVDTQLTGPYAKWHHTHSFHDHPDGTVIRDRVLYRLPMGWLGHLVAGRFVAADVRKIFAYRAMRTVELLQGLL